ncbi:MAG: HD domain-containing protein, partial [Pirellulaceae bacterium]|nr:HD domain-containing protein [Pirellulaceae bacterium]
DHTSVGRKIMQSTSSPVLKMAAVIAATHHEKWDGSGYPRGLAGKQIPIEGRIVAVADVFDALSSKRPYKDAFPIEKCLQILKEGRGQHFDPNVLDAFLARFDDILKTRSEYGEQAANEISDAEAAASETVSVL